MKDPSEENTKDFLCDQLTLFGGTLKDSFVLEVEDNYWVLHGLSDPIVSIGDYKNHTRQSQRLREDWKEQITLKNKMVRSLTSEDRVYKAKEQDDKIFNERRPSHCSY